MFCGDREVLYVAVIPYELFGHGHRLMCTCDRISSFLWAPWPGSLL